MKEIINKINSDKIIKFAVYISSLLVFLQIALCAIFYFSLPPLLPLYNQLPWGLQRLGSKIEIFIPALITLSFFIFNIYLAVRIYSKMPLLSRILSITAMIVCVLSFIYIVRTILLVI